MQPEIPEMMDEHLKNKVLPDDLIAQIVHQHIYCLPLISFAKIWVKFLKHPELLNDPYYIATAPADLVEEARHTEESFSRTQHHRSSPARRFRRNVLTNPRPYN